MKIRRREFMEVLATSALAMSGHGSGSGEESNSPAHTIEKNGWQMKVSATGEIVSLTDGKQELVNRRLGDNVPRVLIMGKKLFTCNQPRSARRENARVLFHYSFSDSYRFSVEYELALLPWSGDSVALKQRILIDAPSKIGESVKLVLPRNTQLPSDDRKVFVPLKNGVGRTKPVLGLENDDEYLFRFAGEFEGGRSEMLAIPMIDEYSARTDLRLTHCADPYFTSHFTLPFGEKLGQTHCIYPARVGLKGQEERTVYTGIHRGDARKAMEVFYATSLGEIKPGPDWLHDIAMIDYDYLSKNGQGWFRDIDKLTETVKPRDRGKVFLALHGWYDVVGRYTYDPRTQSLDKRWTAFPSARNADFQALGDAPESWTEWYWHKRALVNLEPVEMSIADMHRRIRYAKDKGFRVGLYYADGLSAGDAVKEIFDPTKILRWGGWEGPDTQGKTFQQSPLHPGVRDFYKGYLRALVAEYGKEVDGFIMDETFFVDPGDLGVEPYPGYADRAMMTLVKELAAITAEFSPEVPFFASDVIGVRTWTHKAPYALVAHATYQDTGSRPESWPYGLFPNYRNTLWSCNWAPVSNFRFTKYAVETFDTPVTISNGCAGDDIGISDMNPQQLKQILDLFEKRKERKMQIGWIEERPDGPRYQGREIKYRWSL
jgi:hypothetical protein